RHNIYHIWSFPYGVGLKVKIGEFNPYFPCGQQVHLSEYMLEWATRIRQMPSSLCNVDCHPGFRKFHHEGIEVCCFDCVPCPENEVSDNSGK
ncbi:Vomeronasal type-2 receptor 116, partial [Lemmus lemmus]